MAVQSHGSLILNDYLYARCFDSKYGKWAAKWLPSLSSDKYT